VHARAHVQEDLVAERSGRWLEPVTSGVRTRSAKSMRSLRPAGWYGWGATQARTACGGMGSTTEQRGAKQGAGGGVAVDLHGRGQLVGQADGQTGRLTPAASAERERSASSGSMAKPRDDDILDLLSRLPNVVKKK
jgi:hypothetical protein